MTYLVHGEQMALDALSAGFSRSASGPRTWRRIRSAWSYKLLLSQLMFHS